MTRPVSGPGLQALTDISEIDEELDTEAPATESKPLLSAPPLRDSEQPAPVVAKSRGFAGLLHFRRSHSDSVTQQIEETRKLATGASVVNDVAAKLKAMMVGVSPADVRKMMGAHYQQMRLMDAQGQWKVPGAKTEELLPKEMDVNAFIDRVAVSVKDNPYLLAFFADTKGKKFEHLAGKMASEGKQVIPQAIAYAMVQDRLTKAMYDDPKFLEAATLSWEKQAAADPAFKKNLNFFGRMKLHTVQEPIHQMLEFHKNHKIDSQFPKSILPLNIFEATVADAFTGFEGNAVAGAELIKAYNPYTKDNAKTGAQESRFAPDGHGIEMGIPKPKEWADLYATWNMAFVTEQVQSFPFIIGKLLNPQVNQYKDNPRVYMYNRVIALQAQLYYMAFGSMDGALSESINWKDRELGKVWGHANAESARAYERTLKG